MPGRVFRYLTLAVALAVAGLVLPAIAQTPAPGIGMVIMHGKGGSPTRHVAELAAALASRGYLVANLDMPWSGQRNYDADVAAAERQVVSALDGLRARGAAKLFVAGHCQGGLFAL
jgi:predicted alpha/beta-hydrolase family hydrolase